MSNIELGSHAPVLFQHFPKQGQDNITRPATWFLTSDHHQKPSVMWANLMLLQISKYTPTIILILYRLHHLEMFT
uniref:Uncharacterized protein n=1 Tax=Nelumbo nucifera TaxID=4432 RepID=A0A822ZKC9_NELNU|nr:TPA_asm: hypothetical protein HUJ06_003200 [Nelumbo nucifera]